MVSFACLRFSQPPSVLRDFEYTDLNSGLGYTVTKDDYELRKAAHVFGWWWGWREAQHMWDGQGLKYPCFL